MAKQTQKAATGDKNPEGTKKKVEKYITNDEVA